MKGTKLAAFYYRAVRSEAVRVCIAALVLLAGVIPAFAFADDIPASSGPPSELPNQELDAPGIGQLTDPRAAEELPHIELGRTEALELIEAVFEPILEGTSGLVGDLGVERYLSNNAAIVQPADRPGMEPSPSAATEPVLLESTLPLRAENEAGQMAPVDLQLEVAGDFLQPRTPIVPVELPQELGDGIKLPGVDIGIHLVGAPGSRAASIIEENVAVYPNVAPNTDFSVSASPTGVETFTTLRARSATPEQELRLELPNGAELEEAEGGGAEVILSDRTILRVLPPFAVDAAGESVPVDLSVSGASISITAMPGPDASFPVLLDPIIEAYDWYASNSPVGSNIWHPQKNSSLMGVGVFSISGAQEGNHHGLTAHANEGFYPAGSYAGFKYKVPRLDQDRASEKTTTSYISKLNLAYIGLENRGWQTSVEPFLFAGISNEAGQWVGKPPKPAVWTLAGNTPENWMYPGHQVAMENGAPGNRDATAKEAWGIGVMTNSATSANYVVGRLGAASVEVVDDQPPSISVSSGSVSPWINQVATTPLTAEAEDTGLGVKKIGFEVPGAGTLWSTHSCQGTAASFCPLKWTGSVAPGQYNPAQLPQGYTHLPVVAEDVLGSKAASSEKATLLVDHTKPRVELSGTLMEQLKLGTSFPTYILNYSAFDGDPANPAALTPYGTAGTGEGKLQRPMGVAFTSSGESWVADRECKCLQKYDATGKFALQLNKAGLHGGAQAFSDPRGIATTEAGSVWVTDLGNKRVYHLGPAGHLWRTIEYSGFIEPYAIAVTPQEEVWVSDIGTRKVYKLPAAGHTPTAIQGTGPGTGSAEIVSPVGLAADRFGGVWVADNGLNRVTNFSASGQFRGGFGSTGTGPGQLKGPVGLATAQSGNVLVADGDNNRVQVFRPTGKFIRQFGAAGSGASQLKEPRGIAVTPGNIAVVADAGNKRIAKWSHADFDPQSGVVSTEIRVDGQLAEPKYAPGCAVENCAISNKTWTLDARNYPVGMHMLEFTATDGVGLQTTKYQNFETKVLTPTLAVSGTMTEQASIGTTRPRYKVRINASAESGVEGEAAPPAYISAFGTYGTADGQFKQPAGIARAADGTLWVVDHENNRVQHFDAKGKYLGKFGSFGTGNGQFDRPIDIDVDATGNLWITDAGNDRIQKFSPSGTFLSQFGSFGSSTGKFNFPEGVAIDAKGNVWVSDTRNHRLQKFNASGNFLKAVGSFGTGQGQLREPSGVDVGPGGNILVADWENNRVVVFSEEGVFQRQFGIEGEGPGQFRNPVAIDVDSSGYVWVSDERNERVEQFDQAGNFITQFGTEGTGAGEMQLTNPMGMVSGPEGRIWVADSSNDRVQEWKVPDVHVTYSSAFGAFGTGNGQLSQPAGIARAADGTFWVADADNHRVQHFSAAGAYLGKFGSFGTGNGQFNKPTDLEIDGAGNIYVADTRNHRVQKFNSAGTFLSKFGAVGTANGQFQYPEGLAIDKGGNIWVADTVNNRLQKFSSAGAFLKAVGSAGSGQGQLYSPMGIDAGPGGGILVADWDNNRVVVFNEEGVFQRQFGIEGYDEGEFNGPVSIEVDANGLVLVSDERNERVEQFDQAGNFITQFGTEGTGAGQMELTNPMGIVTGPEGRIWITDSSNDRVQEWRQSKSVSEVFTEILLDGKIVDASHTKCAGQQCPLEREWTLDSLATQPGNHTIVAKVTDGLGQMRSKTLNIAIARDVVAPTITANKSFFAAPDGWVEQDIYPYEPVATDNGFGTTSLVFKVDGATVKSASQTCSDGGCGLNPVSTINMAPYKGGAHTAELIATDGAGNIAKKTWSLNVSPAGEISAGEATDTLEAVEATDEEAVLVAPNGSAVPPAEIAAGNDPAVIQQGTDLVIDGVPVKTEFTTSPSEGITIPTLSGDIEVEPIGIDPDAIGTVVGDQAAVVAPDTRTQVDTVLRPLFGGITNFDVIRGPSATEQFSWKLNLHPLQRLEPVDDKTAEVVFADGESVMMIRAESARDATGKAVPTSLQVIAEDAIQLTVSHKGKGYAYPVTAGPSFEVGYSTVIHIPPPPPSSPAADLEAQTFSTLVVGAPEAVSGSESGGGASVSVAKGRKRPFWRSICGHRVGWLQTEEGVRAIVNGEGRCGNGFRPDLYPGEEVVYRGTMRGMFFYAPGEEVSHKGARDCINATPTWSDIQTFEMYDAYECHYGPKTSDGNGGGSANAGHYLRAQAHWMLRRRNHCVLPPEHPACPPIESYPWVNEDKALELHLFPTGVVKEVVIDGYPGGN